LGQLRDIETQINEMGFQLIGISPDRPANVRETSEKYKFRGPLLSDSRMTAALAFRLAYEVDETTLQQLKNYGVDLEEASGEKHHLLPVPAVFVVASSGIIQFSYVNPDYKVRLHPDLLLASLRSARR